MKTKLLFLAPHVSTGGMPSFLLKRIQLLNDLFDIYVVEYACLSDTYIVQRKQIQEIVKDKSSQQSSNTSTTTTSTKSKNKHVVNMKEITQPPVPITNKVYKSTMETPTTTTTPTPLVDEVVVTSDNKSVDMSLLNEIDNSFTLDNSISEKPTELSSTQDNITLPNILDSPNIVIGGGDGGNSSGNDLDLSVCELPTISNASSIGGQLDYIELN